MEGLDCGLMALLNWSTRTTFGVSNSFALAVVQEELAQHLLRHNGEPIVAFILAPSSSSRRFSNKIE